jgi:hypothetical protein
MQDFLIYSFYRVPKHNIKNILNEIIHNQVTLNQGPLYH